MGKRSKATPIGMKSLYMSDNSEPGLIIVYDGECPFCSRYVNYLRLREAVGRIELINARTGHHWSLTEIRRRNIDLNREMVAIYRGTYYAGDKCVHLLATLSNRDDPANFAMAHLFRKPAVARLIYPILRFGRNLTLRALRRRPLNSETLPGKD